jgi:hypothetical protein
MTKRLKTIPVLEQANAIVQGSRRDQYGGPERSAQAIGDLWTGLLRNAGLLRKGKVVSGEMACILLAGLKLARLSGQPRHVDSQVDTCGYIALLSTIQDDKKAR